ncbi:MAG: selenium cofactor biosynthesis protein YqeC [Suipraeoptans sp.]
MYSNKRDILPVITVRAKIDKVFFGPGVMVILEGLEATGSIKESCKQSGISYSKAWKILNTAEKQLGSPLVTRKQGGKSGGGCRITREGYMLMKRYRAAEVKIKEYAKDVFKEVMNDNINLSEVLGITKNDIITISGAGGKTSCLYRLGEELKQSKVLLTTTTKMMLPKKDEDVEFIYTENQALKKDAKYGRTFVYGEINEKNKCTAISYDGLNQLSKAYHYTVIEADGSRGLSLKGYLDNEPCIPKYATCNIGIVTVNEIGNLFSETNTLRIRELLGMIKKSDDSIDKDVITSSDIATWISHPKGMFKGSEGRKIVFFNKIEDQTSEKLVQEVIEALPNKFASKLDLIAMGSFKEGRYSLCRRRALY